MLPDAHTVHPAQPCPPHWLYLTAEQVDVAVAAPLVVVLEIAVDVAAVVELTKVVLRVDVGVLEIEEEEEEEEPLPPEDPVKVSVNYREINVRMTGLTSRSRNTRCNASALDVHPGKVQILVRVGVSIPGQFQNTKMPVSAIAARADTDG